MDPRSLYLFFGAPGSGKGTLSKQCTERLRFEQLSTGNLLREHVAHGSEVGKKIDLALKSGKLIDDSLITTMVIDWLGKAGSKRDHIILDGYPRTVIQAEAFNQFVQQQEGGGPLVVKLKIDEQSVIDRLSMRLICSKEECQAVYSLASGSQCRPQFEAICDICSAPLIRRSDDEVDAIKKRLHVYSRHESVLLDFYDKKGYRVITLDAFQPIDVIFEEFKSKVGGFS
jgi:adenylate kinase